MSEKIVSPNQFGSPSSSGHRSLEYDAPKRIVSIILPNGYKDADEFAKDCGFELGFPECVPVKLTSSAHRLWMAINGHDVTDFSKRAEIILRSHIDGMLNSPSHRATIKVLLIEHFEQIDKAAREAKTVSDDRSAADANASGSVNP